MTEQEIERCLERFATCKTTDVMNFDYAGTFAYIKRLKAENASLRNEADENSALSMENKMRADCLEKENAALRERLENAVELPVKLYSKVWDKNRKEFEIIGIELHGTNYYINCANKATGEIASFDGEDIGDEFFTTEELCDLHRRAFGLDKSKIEAAEASLAELTGGKK